MTDWDRIRHVYENTGKTLVEIANDFGVKPSTLRSHKLRNHWQRVSEVTGNHPKGGTMTRTTPEKRRAKKRADRIIKVMDDNNLNDRQKIFCLNYLKNHNATQSYITAYGANYEYAMHNASRLLATDKIKKMMDGLKQQQLEELYFDIDDILITYAKQATADIRTVVDFKTVKKMKWSKVYTKHGDHKDASGKSYEYQPWIDPDTGQQGYYFEPQVMLKDSSEIDTSMIRSIRIDKGQPVVEMVDQQKALKELLDRIGNKDLIAAKAKKAIIEATAAKAELDDMQHDKENGDTQINFIRTDRRKDDSK